MGFCFILCLLFTFICLATSSLVARGLLAAAGEPLASCGSRVSLWLQRTGSAAGGLDPAPGGIKSVSAALEGGFLTTGPPGKPLHGLFRLPYSLCFALPQGLCTRWAHC